MAAVLLRFRDLKDRKIVSNHVTLGRWIAKEGFPRGFLLGPNTRVWCEDDIDAWIMSRPASGVHNDHPDDNHRNGPATPALGRGRSGLRLFGHL